MKTTRSVKFGLFGVCIGLAAVAVGRAQTTEVVLHNFETPPNGAFPGASVIRDTPGNLYGTTINGGASNAGVVFKLDTTGHQTVLYSFTGGADGGIPYAGVIRDPAGNLYGTTAQAGALGWGVVFKLDTTGHETVLYTFTGGADGADPLAGVILDSAGNLYGTTYQGGAANAGVVFKLDTTGHETVLYSFCTLSGCADGDFPNAGVIRDTAGNLYGTTTDGGASGFGVVFKLDTTSHETVLHSFTGGTDGGQPYAGVIRDPAGNLYGTTNIGGASSCLPNGCGMVFKLSTTGHETVLHSFTGGADGGFPRAAVIRDTAGNLYGTTAYGGASNVGVIFKLDTTGHETVLYSLTGADGDKPLAGVIRDTAGNLYGTTQAGGASNLGVVFKVDTTDHETVVYSFPGGADGDPYSSVVRDTAGNLYGTTVNGGAAGKGVVFKLDTTGHETVVYTFTGGADGGVPYAGVIRDSAGNLYGTTTAGGTSGKGVVFKVDSTGLETVLYSFTGGADGSSPYAGVVRDTAGNLYGTTYYGGASSCPSLGCGVVFKLDTTGHETVLYSFTGGADGGNPYAGVIDSAGTLYGTTVSGGTSGFGVVFKLDTTGHETVLYTFTNGADGGYSYAGVILDPAGNLYGTTYQAGTSNMGVVFKLDTTGHETVLHTFTGGTDGGHPIGGVIRDSAGNLYGTTYQGGSSNAGLVFKLDTTSHETVLHSFTAGADGGYPYAGVIRDTAGNLYGTTVSGGAASGGVVFELKP